MSLSSQNLSSKQTSTVNKTNAKVAIIGASYAGLTLCNALKKHSIPFVIFESSPDYYSGKDEATMISSENDNSFVMKDNTFRSFKQNQFVVGPFILPSFGFISRELGIELMTIRDEDKRISTGSNNDVQVDHCYERCDIVLSLLENIQNSIEYETTINSIMQFSSSKKEEQFYCTSGYDTRKHGPFEYIIAADGVHSIIGSKHQMNDDNKILLIGDARWVNDSWYNFGFSRVKEGADIAMRDGIELGYILTKLLNREVDTNGVEQADYFETIDILRQKYSANQKFLLRKRKRLVRRVLMAVVIAFLIEKFRVGTNVSN